MGTLTSSNFVLNCPSLQLRYISSLQDVKATNARVLGVLPFRDKWIGHTQTLESRLAVDSMRDELGAELMLPSIRESERYKQAINKRTTLAAMGYADLEYPFEVILSKIRQLLGGDAACQTVS